MSNSDYVGLYLLPDRLQPDGELMLWDDVCHQGSRLAIAEELEHSVAVVARSGYSEEHMETHEVAMADGTTRIARSSGLYDVEKDPVDEQKN